MTSLGVEGEIRLASCFFEHLGLGHLVPYATRFFTAHPALFFFICAPPCSSFLLFMHHHFNILTLLHFESDHVCFLPAPPFSLSLRTPPVFLIAALASLCTHLPIFVDGTTMFTDPTPLACFIVFLGLFYIYLLHYHFYCTHPIYSMYLSLITHVLSYFIFYFYPSETISSFIYLSFLLFFFF